MNFVQTLLCANLSQRPAIARRFGHRTNAQAHNHNSALALFANIGASKRPWSMQNVLWLFPIRSLYKNPVLIVIQAQGLFAEQKYGQQMEIAV